MPFRPLDGANRHHDLELRRNAELTAHGRGLVQQVQAEVSQVDGVVDAVDRRGKTRGHRIRDGDDAPRMTQDELRLRVSQPRIGAEHLAHDPHDGHAFAARRRRPCQQDTRVEMHKIWVLLLERGSSAQDRSRKGSDEAGDRSRVQARVGRVKERPAGLDHLHGQAKIASVLDNRARLGKDHARLELRMVEGGEQLQQRHRCAADAPAVVHCKEANRHTRSASVASTTRAAHFQLWVVCTRRRPAAPSAWSRPGSARSALTASAIASTDVPSTSTPVWPSTTASTSPPDRPARTGRPQAAASKYTSP